MSRSRSPYRDPWWDRTVADGVPPRPVAGETSGERDFDVVVVGAGMAGHVASIFSTRYGCSVVMLEAAEEAGGTAYKSGGGMWIPDNSIMRDRGLGPDREWAIHHMARLAYPDDYDPEAPRLGLGELALDLIETYYESAAETIDELRALGLTLMEFPSFTGEYEAMVEYHGDVERGFGAHLSPRQANGEYGAGLHLIQQLSDLAVEAGAELRTGQRVVDVHTGADGRVDGVIVDTGAGLEEIGARRGVIFASGGYAHDRELTGEHFPGGLYGSCAVPTGRGDFVRIGRRLGAEIANMGEGWGTEHPLEQMLASPEVAEHIGVFPGDSVLMVNAEGRRVVNEKLIYHERSKIHFERDGEGNLPNHLTFLIYDDFIVDDRTSQPNRWPDPSPGNAWVISSDTLDSLSDAIDARLASYGDRTGGVRLAADFKDRLAATVRRFGEAARTGVDLDFHRGETAVELDWTGPCHLENEKNPTLWPLDDGPFHCIILAGSVLDTNGGPVADRDGRILRPDGSAIAGLYGAGNCVASAAGAGYWSGGSTLGPAATFAHRAARHLAAQPVPAARVAGQRD